MARRSTWRTSGSRGRSRTPAPSERSSGWRRREKIPKGEIASKISDLKQQAEGDKKLSAAKRTMLKQLVLARTLGEMKK